MQRYTMIFATCPQRVRSVETIINTLILVAIEAGISGLTAWQSIGWCKQYGKEETITVEFVAGYTTAPIFAGLVCIVFAQDCVYLASGNSAKLVNHCGDTVETIANY